MSTTTEIATVGEVSYAALTTGSRQAAILRANLGDEPMTEMDLVSISAPTGGATTWSYQINGNNETAEELVGLLVAVGKRGELWPTDDPSDKPPVIVSNDLRVGYRVSDDLGTIDPDALEKYRTGDCEYDWVALSNSPEFGYGAGRNGSGKRVKETRRLAILREGDVWPLVVKVGPGSLRRITKFLRQLPCFCWEAVIGLSLERAKSNGGQPYSQIAARLVGTISEEQGEVARVTYHEPLDAMFSARPNTVAAEE